MSGPRSTPWAIRYSMPPEAIALSANASICSVFCRWYTTPCPLNVGRSIKWCFFSSVCNSSAEMFHFPGPTPGMAHEIRRGVLPEPVAATIRAHSPIS